MSEKLELDIIHETANFLSVYGITTDICYLTAELAPFTNQFVPDLIVRIADDLPAFFIEYKLSSKENFDKLYHKYIIEKSEFILSSFENKIQYIFCTDGYLTENQIKYLEEHGIICWCGLDDSIVLYKKILAEIETSNKG